MSLNHYIPLANRFDMVYKKMFLGHWVLIIYLETNFLTWGLWKNILQSPFSSNCLKITIYCFFLIFFPYFRWGLIYLSDPKVHRKISFNLMSPQIALKLSFCVRKIVMFSFKHPSLSNITSLILLVPPVLIGILEGKLKNIYICEH